MGNNRNQIPLHIASVVLLAVFAVLILGASSRHMEPDEGIALQDTLTSIPATMDREVKDVEAPLYYVSLNVWQTLVGHREFTGRIFSLLTSMLTVSTVYLIGRRSSQWAGIAAMLALGLSSYFFIYALQIRPYPQLILTTTLSMWFFIRWLEEQTWRRVLIYAVTVALLLYLHYFGTFVILIQGIYFLLLYGRSKWAIWKQGAVAMLVAFCLWLPWFPVFISQVLRSGSFVKSTDTLIPGLGKGGPRLLTSPQTVSRFIMLVTNKQPFIFAAIILIGLVFLRSRRQYWLAVAWAFGIPAAMLLSNLIVPTYEPQYISNIAPGLALLVGLSLAEIPKSWKLAGTAAFSVMALFTVTSAVGTSVVGDPIPVRDLLREFNAAYRPSEAVYLDHVVIDDLARSQYSEYAPTAWANVQQIESRSSMKNVRLPRCLWYVTRDWPNPDVQKNFNYLSATHASQNSIGDERYLFLQLCAPPQMQPHRFGASMQFRGAEVETGSPGQVILKLWWSVSKKLVNDFSIQVYVLNEEGIVVAQHDGPIILQWAAASLQTSSMLPGVIYLSRATISLPANLYSGSYQMGLKVYRPGNMKVLSIDGSPDGLLIINTLAFE